MVFSKNIQKIIFITLLSWVFNVEAFAAANSPMHRVETQLRLKMTHAVYTAVIAHHFENRFEKYEPVVLADRIFLLTFLNEWQRKIDTRKFSTTRDIFSEMIVNESFLRKFYRLWYEIHSPRESYFELEKRKWFSLTSINSIYQLEISTVSAKEFAQEILEFVSSHIIAKEQNQDLAQLFYEGFKNSQVVELREQALRFKSEIIFGKTIDVANIILSLGSLAKGVDHFFKIDFSKQLKNLKNFFENKKAKLPKAKQNFKKRLRHGGLAFSRIGTKSYDLYKKFNPFYRGKLIHKTFGLSAAVHIGVITTYRDELFNYEQSKYLTPKEKVAVEQLKVVEEKKQQRKELLLLIDDFAGFYQILIEQYPIMTASDYRDFKPQFQLWSRDTLVKQIQDFLNIPDEQNPNLFASVLIQSEKHLSVDERQFEDDLAMQVITDNYLQLQSKVKKIVETSNAENFIANFRKLVVEGPLESYMRDNPSLTSLMLGWGGNCVGETALLTSLLYPYKDSLPGNWKLGIVLEPLHIETVLFNDNEFVKMVSGSKQSSDDKAFYKSEFLALLMLRNFLPQSQIKLGAKDLIAFDSRSEQFSLEELLKDGFNFSLPSLKAMMSLFAAMFKREKGALDTVNVMDNISTSSLSSLKESLANLSEIKAIPEQAKRTYRKVVSVKTNQEVQENYRKDLVGTTSDGSRQQESLKHSGKNNLVSKSKKTQVKTNKFQLNIKQNYQMNGETKGAGNYEEALKSSNGNYKNGQGNNEESSEKGGGNVLGNSVSPVSLGLITDTGMEINANTEEFFEKMSLLKLKPNLSQLDVLKEIVYVEQEFLMSMLEESKYDKLSSVDYKLEVNNCNRLAPCELDSFDKKMNPLFDAYDAFIKPIYIYQETLRSEKRIHEQLFSQGKVDREFDSVRYPNVSDIYKLTNEIYNQKIQSIFNNRIEFTRYYSKNPRKFLELFNSFNNFQRKSLMSFMLNSSFENIGSNALMSARNLTFLQQELYENVSTYLYILDQIKVISGENVITSNIMLPVLPNLIGPYPRSGLFIVYNEHEKVNKDAANKFSEHPDKIDKSLDSSNDTLSIRDDVLIEATFIFGKGHQLWVPRMIDLFRDGFFEDHGLSIDEIKTSLEEGLEGYPGVKAEIFKDIESLIYE
ncbi:MAG: hypothetical protein HOO06_09865 [Bdellovibrionaceae bacterium]|jgi:hypothetical protein|nr:hypothetical protein [Pseudobdellovibrionaceae bacterium]